MSELGRIQQLTLRGPETGIQSDKFSKVNYVNTGEPNIIKLNVGETWYAKYPGATGVVTLDILDLSKLTVLVKEKFHYSEVRYKISDIEWIEKVK